MTATPSALRTNVGRMRKKTLIERRHRQQEANRAAAARGGTIPYPSLMEPDMLATYDEARAKWNKQAEDRREAERQQERERAKQSITAPNTKKTRFTFWPFQ